MVTCYHYKCLDGGGNSCGLFQSTVLPAVCMVGQQIRILWIVGAVTETQVNSVPSVMTSFLDISGFA